jgi:hypothetical protein
LSEAQPDLNDVFRVAFERLQADIRTATVGTVTRFTRSPNRECSVRVDMLAQLRSGDAVEIPEVDRVPIVWPFGGGWSADADLAIGEQVLLLVIDRDISSWLPAGGEVEPTRRALHKITNAVAIPGLWSINNQSTQAPAPGELRIGAHSSASPRLTLGTLPAPNALIEATTIKLGAGATPLQGAARVGDDVVPDVTMATWISAVTTFINTLASGTLILPSDFGLIFSGSTKTRIE